MGQWRGACDTPEGMRGSSTDSTERGSLWVQDGCSKRPLVGGDPGEEKWGNRNHLAGLSGGERWADGRMSRRCWPAQIAPLSPCFPAIRTGLFRVKLPLLLWIQRGVISRRIRMSISSGDTSRDTLRNTVLPAIWHPLVRESGHRQ